MAERPPSVEVSTRLTALVLAVQLVDGYTGDPPSGAFDVGIEGLDPGLGLDPSPVRNPSGYYLFLDFPVMDEAPLVINDDAVLTVESVEGMYLPEELPVADLQRPAATVVLTPAPSYRFPGVTAARGIVEGVDGAPLEGAIVSATGTDRTTRTDARGEFVLPFSDLDVETVVTPGSTTEPATVERFVKAGGTDPKLTVIRPAGDPSDPADVRTATGKVSVGSVWFVKLDFL